MTMPLVLQLILKKQGIIHEIRMPNDSSSQVPPAAMYAGYPPGRMPYGGQTYQQYNNQGKSKHSPGKQSALTCQQAWALQLKMA